jgi:capsular exopolysaccharide synthesis family protein
MSYNVIDRQPLPQVDDINSFEDKGSEINFEKLIFIVRKNIFYLVLLLIIGIVGAFVYLRYTKAIYEATAQIKLEYKTSSKIIDIEMPFDAEGNAEYLAGEIQIIRSNPIYQALLDSLNLRVSYHAIGEIIDSEIYKSSPFKVTLLNNPSHIYINQKFNIKILNKNQFLLSYTNESGEKYENEYNFDTSISIYGIDFKILLIHESYSGDYFFNINSDESLFNYIDKNLTVSIFNIQSNTINLSFKDNNSTKATDILHFLIKIYYSYTIEKKNRAFEQALNYLGEQINSIRDSLDLIENEMQDIMKSTKKPFEEELRLKFAQINEYEGKKLELELLLNNYQKLEELLPTDTTFIYSSALASIIGNQNLQEFIKTMIESKSEYDRIQSYYKETTHSRNQRLKEIEKQKEKLFELIRFHKEMIMNQLKENEKDIQLFKNELILESENYALKKLNKNYSIYENISNLMLSKTVEINIAKSGTVADFQIINKPKTSKKPISPVPIMIYGIGFVTGIFLCIVYVILLYVLDNKIGSVKDIESKTNQAILGVLPYFKSDKLIENSKFVIDINPKSAISEAFRNIRTNLDFMGATQKRKIITVTSTISGEGKTFIAVNLAGIVALSGSKVVVVDLDLRKPKIHRAFDGENIFGVSSVLIGKSSLNEVIIDTHIPTLKYITSGAIPPNPSELLLSEKFSEMLEALQKEFDVVILDTPPVGLVTDGILVMRNATIPLYVMRAGYSRLNFIENIQKLVVINKFTNTSIILNAVDSSSSYGYGSGYYKYGYLYGNSYGYEEVSENSEKWYHKILSKFKPNHHS